MNALVALVTLVTQCKPLLFFFFFFFHLKDVRFIRRYSKYPIVILTAKHSSRGNGGPECNGIASWIEVQIREGEIESELKIIVLLPLCKYSVIGL